MHVQNDFCGSRKLLVLLNAIANLCPENRYEGRKEGNVLFNDAHNTFYLRLYGVGHMVKDHPDSKKGNPVLSHGDTLFE